MLTEEQQFEILNQLRWYGHTIAGGAPMIGYGRVAREAEKYWYSVTLPFLTEHGLVYENSNAAIKPPERVT